MPSASSPAVAEPTGQPAATAGTLRVTDLCKTYQGTRGADRTRVAAVHNVSLRIEQGRFLTLLGPSGCGKTTSLRCIAGLERPDSGEIVLGDRVLFSSARSIQLPASTRGLGMVFQSYAIWPHMSVFENVAFPLQVAPHRRRLSRRQIREHAERALAAVRLDGLAGRSATTLSGGQQQRLALARALVMEPPLLLLDEPLSNLDAKLREGLRFELKRLQRELGVTTLYVTHDQAEALSMSNTIAIMRDGVIEQLGTPREVYDKPVSLFAANFIGTSNFITGRVSSRVGSDAYRVDHPAGPLVASSEVGYATGADVVVSIRPERVEVVEGHVSSRGPGQWPGVVRARAFLGEAVDYLVWAGEQEIRLRCDAERGIPTGAEVTLTFPQRFCAMLPAPS